MLNFKEYILKETSRTIFDNDTIFDINFKSINKHKLNGNIKKWYVEKFKNDEIGQEINPKYKFIDAINCLMNGDDIYDLIPNDSVIRERLFSELSRLSGIDYEIWYNTYLMTSFDIKAFKEKQKKIGWKPIKWK